jgi:hypothetical protein
MATKTVYVYDGKSGEYIRGFTTNNTRHILKVLRSGDAAEVEVDGKPLTNYKDRFIRTDTDGFALLA